jgi:serine/threonine protein kinase
LFKSIDRSNSDSLIADFGVSTRLEYEYDSNGQVKGEGIITDIPNFNTVDGLPGYYGTMGYTAPEVLLRFNQGVKIDSWAIG